MEQHSTTTRLQITTMVLAITKTMGVLTQQRQTTMLQKNLMTGRVRELACRLNRLSSISWKKPMELVDVLMELRPILIPKPITMMGRVTMEHMVAQIQQQ